MIERATATLTVLIPALLVLAALTTPGCGAARLPSHLAAGPGTAARCRVGRTQTSLLVTEWSATEKSNHEPKLAGGAQPVPITGCQLRLLPQCRLPGRYAWLRTTPATDVIELRNEADLYAKLPLGAVSLSAELERSGSLAVETTVAGQARLDGADAGSVPSTHECASATHVIGAVSIGAFALTTESSIKAGGGVDHAVIGVGGSAGRSTKVMRASGDPKACGEADEQGPVSACASPLQVFLLPIAGRAPIPGPPGSVRVDFISATADRRWDVYVDDKPTCTTPCARWIDPSRPLVMRTRGDRPDRLRVGRLNAAAGPQQLIAEPTNKPKLVTGITFTALGGMAMITGTALSGIGCSSRGSDGMCNAGMITLTAGTVVTTGAIMLMLRALPELHIRPLFGPPSAIDAPR